MDQIKIGKFIQELRKENNMTQRSLADALSISDKTISKWETGKGLPEVSIMLPLCDTLGISVNELLSGERLDSADYHRKAEENIMDLMKERQENKKKVIVSVIVGVITMLATLTILMSAAYFEMANWLRVLLTVIALIVLAGGIAAAAMLEWNAGTYECRHCKTRFLPSFGAYLAAPHSLTTRLLTCPNCGKKSFCKRRLTH